MRNINFRETFEGTQFAPECKRRFFREGDVEIGS